MITMDILFHNSANWYRIESKSVGCCNLINKGPDFLLTK